MAELVGAFGVPHMPNTPLNSRQSPDGELAQLFGAVREHIDAVDPDALVVFDTDHFAMRRPMVPFWINGIAPPLPLSRRVYAAGQMVRRSIESAGGQHTGGHHCQWRDLG